MDLLERRRELLLNSSSGGGIPIPSAPYGVYILSIDNTLYTEDKWTQSNNNAVGVAVVVNNRDKFVIAPEDLGRMAWGDPDLIISGIVTTIRTSEAKRDYKGNDNTTHIINQDNMADAAKYCREYTFKNGKKGYLGAAGEWNAVLHELYDIDHCMNKIGGDVLDNKYPYWTSTQHSRSNAWFSDLREGYITSKIKFNSVNTRPFCIL